MKFAAATLKNYGQNQAPREIQGRIILMSEEETHTFEFQEIGKPTEYLYFLNPRFKFHGDGVTVSGYANQENRTSTATYYTLFLWKSKTHPEI